MAPTSGHKGSVRIRLLSRILFDNASGCWNYSGHITKPGYGWININGHPSLAHRVSFSEFVGRIPDGMCVCHKCDNRKCFNPDHLFLGTQKENMDDRDRKGRVRRNVWPVNGKAKLSDSRVAEIYQFDKNGMSDLSLGRLFGVAGNTINSIRTGLRRRHVTSLLELGPN